MEPAYSIRISRLAVQSKVFPLYEVENGEKYTINVWPRREVPVREYLTSSRAASATSPKRTSSSSRRTWIGGGRGWWAGRVSDE